MTTGQRTPLRRASDRETPPGVHAERLAELVAQLTGEDPRDSVEATAALLGEERAPEAPLQIVARAILDLRESGRALRVTRYLGRTFEPVIDLRDSRDPAPPGGGSDDIDARFRRLDRASGSRPSRFGDRPAGSSTSGFAPA
jgi:hypothetical protein